MRTNRTVVAIVATLAALVGMTAVAAPARAVTGTSAIAGQVLAWMDPIGQARVTVYRARTGAVLASVLTDGDGQYRLTGLPAVGVTVRASKDGYLDAWAGGGNTRATATVYQLQPGQVLEQSWDPMVLYLDLTPEAVVTGAVRGVNGSPGCLKVLRGARVSVVSVETGKVVGTTRTGADGQFRIGMLRGGQVIVRAEKGGWVTTWAPDATRSAGAEVFELIGTVTTDAGVITMQSRHPRKGCS